MTRTLAVALFATGFVSVPALAAPPAQTPAPIAQPTRINLDAQYLAIEKQHARLSHPMSPAARAKVIAAARIVNSRFSDKPAPGAKALEPLQVARAAATQVDLTGADIEAIAFLVLMQAARDAEQDLKSIMAEVKAANKAKECLRSPKCKHANVDELRASLQPTEDMPKAAIDAVLDALKGKLDSMNELYEMTSLRLQMAMDRRSKFIETLSNILKKISTTSDSIVQNLK